MRNSTIIARAAIFASVAVVLGFIESLIPAPTGIYGIKLGLSNIVVLAALYLLNERNALWAAIIKTVISALLYGGLSGFLYSVSGAFLSLSAQILCKKTRAFSVIGVSCMGGIFHNIGQFICASLIIGKSVIYYFPVLLVSGAATGIVTGAGAALLIKRGRDIFGSE